MSRRRTLLVTFSTVFCIAVVGLLAVDAVITSNSMNPVPAANAAVADAGWDADAVALESFTGSGKLLGSEAVVKYRVRDTEDAQLLEVHLRRSFVSSNWRATKLGPR